MTDEEAISRLRKADVPIGSRILVWFSCGAASAVVAKMTRVLYPRHNVELLYCNTSKSEHHDNERFMGDVGRWVGIPVKVLSSEKFTTVEEVFEKRKYMSGVKGAPCTVELKKKVRMSYQQADDYHVFGYTCDEYKRVVEFRNANPELTLLWPLLDNFVTKRDCFASLSRAGITLPTLYLMGYEHNNCMGCVKSQSPAYWNNIRRDFPQIFAIRCEQSRRLGVRLVKLGGERIFLDELPSDSDEVVEEDLSCGPQCAVTVTT